MDTMKEWIAMKCNKTNKSPTNQQKLSPVRTQFAQVVTPENIPDFIIPPKVNYLATTPEEVDHPQQFSFNGIEDTQQPFNDFEKTSYSNNLQLPSRMNLPTTIRKYRSAPPSPCKTTEAYMISEKGTLSDGHLENLDIFSEDSFSISALTIPYLRTKTSYGFSTLSESPHTRRKESLFHNGTVSRPMKSLKNDRREFTSCDTVGGVSVGKLSLPIGHPLVRAASCNCRPSSLLAPKAPRNIGSDGNGSDSSLGSTPSRLSMSPVSSTHSTPEIPRKQKVNKIASRTERYYYRRRSSLKNLESGKPAEKCQCGCGGVVSDCSSVEPSPLQVRRKSNDGLSKRDTNHIQSQLNAHATSTSIQKSASQNSKLESGLNRLTSVEDRSIADRGELKFAVKYDPKIEILTVNVLKAENLSLKNKSEQVVNSCVKCYLLPGKQQKQVTHVIQQTNNPIFNQQFIFTAIDREEIANMKLCLRVLHKTPALKRSEFIGEVVLPLKSTQDEEEVRLWRYLQAHNDTQESGQLKIGLNFEPKHERLSVSLHQATGLSKSQIRGNPDPYVKVTVLQPGTAETKRQTMPKKKTCSPIFDETFRFIVSPKIEDLKYTSVNIAVYDHELLKSDCVLGEIRLGFGSCLESGQTLWMEVLENPGSNYVKWLTLNKISYKDCLY